MCAKKYVLDKDVVSYRLSSSIDSLRSFIKNFLEKSKEFNLEWATFHSTRAASQFASIAAYEYVLEPNVEKFHQRLRSAVAYSYKGMDLIKRIPPEKHKDYIGLPSCGAGNLSMGSCTLIGEYATGRYCEEMNRPFLQPKEREEKWPCYFQCEWSRQALYNKDHLEEILPLLEDCYIYSSKNDKDMLLELDILKSIIARDKSLFNEKVSKSLDDYPKYMKKHTATTLSIGDLRYCHTAMLLGMEVEVDHQFLPKELLLNPETIRSNYTKTDLITEDFSEFKID
ncbi:MAG: hypothetical protein C0412_06855 [Flavobacterium sp.]|nr:hypothetical protein [Flavobacterium sp.]